ncbi:MAG: hypothetical protein VXY05_05255, partial [Pseudomonadota bacterium]|nr:hypothetical protein [Pseudomonadota bacterium]
MKKEWGKALLSQFLLTCHKARPDLVSDWIGTRFFNSYLGRDLKIVSEMRQRETWGSFRCPVTILGIGIYPINTSWLAIFIAS